MKKTLLLICLSLLITMLVLPTYAQSPELESIPLGWKVKIDRPVTVFGDHLGHPNPHERYTLNARYFFQVIGEQAEGCDQLTGKVFTKILIPGVPGKADTSGIKMRSAVENHLLSEDYQEFMGVWDEKNEDDSLVLGDLVEAMNMIHKAVVAQVPSSECPDSYPALSEQEKQVQETEKGKVLWIETSKLTADNLFDNDDHSKEVENEHVDTKLFTPAKLFSKTFVSVLTVPFKYRFSYKKGQATVLTAESSIGPSIGFSLARSKFFDRNLWLLGSAGITIINPNLLLADSAATKLKMEPGVTACVGIGGNIGTTQFGIVHGWDFTDETWEFHKKPWLAFSVGFALSKRPAKSADQ